MISVRFWPLKMPTANFSMVLVLLMLMPRKVLLIVWSRFWSWGLEDIWILILVTILKLKFCQDIEVYFWSRLWGWDLIKILKLRFGQDFEIYFWSTRSAWDLVKILKLNFGHVVKAEVELTLLRPAYLSKYKDVTGGDNVPAVGPSRVPI